MCGRGEAVGLDLPQTRRPFPSNRLAQLPMRVPAMMVCDNVGRGNR
ncbi:hypothetical protein [Candidatus Leptofilum sp.]